MQFPGTALPEFSNKPGPGERGTDAKTDLVQHNPINYTQHQRLRVRGLDTVPCFALPVCIDLQPK